MLPDICDVCQQHAEGRVAQVPTQAAEYVVVSCMVMLLHCCSGQLQYSPAVPHALHAAHEPLHVGGCCAEPSCWVSRFFVCLHRFIAALRVGFYVSTVVQRAPSLCVGPCSSQEQIRLLVWCAAATTSAFLVVCCTFLWACTRVFKTWQPRHVLCSSVLHCG
jgi:hypothetical protein